MRILGIETSCDETAAAIVQDGRIVLSTIIASSKKEQELYGGVFPEVAARRQLECIVPAIHQALERARLPTSHLDAIAVTKGPGLLPSLLVGNMAARTLASVWKKPLIGVHHTLGHLDSPWLECGEDPAFPLLTLSVSGGHTELWLRESHTKGKVLGRTLDDAAGEAFDKGATLLGLPYPGGPALSALAEKGNPASVRFPSPLEGHDGCDFSFAGLKTSLKYMLRDRGGLLALSEQEKRDTAASFQETICAHLLSGISKALKLCPEAREVHLVGGVSANTRLRKLLTELLSRGSLRTRIRTPTRMEYCTDNAAMIAAAGYFLVEERGEDAFDTFSTEASIVLHL